MREPSRDELVGWDELVTANPDGGHFLQTRAWGEFKRRWGWTPLYRIAEAGGEEIAVLFLRRHVPGLGDLWYAPKGPGVTEPAALVESLADRGAMRGAFAVKVEPEISEAAAQPALWRSAGLVKSAGDVQMSRSTIIVDLSRDEDAILASFKPKCRYNIRLAARRGVEIEAVPASDANLALMYSLMAATCDRAGFVLRTEEYFRQYWQLLAASGIGQLFLARVRGDAVAGVFVAFLGSHGWYKDGGSTGEHRELMAPHLLQWEVMRWLRARGVRTYDLVAVPPSSRLDASHPLFGIYRFKSGFSEAVTDFVGTWDLPLRPRAYAVWSRVGEAATQRLRWRLRHDQLY